MNKDDIDSSVGWDGVCKVCVSSQRKISFIVDTKRIFKIFYNTTCSGDHINSCYVSI